MHPTNIVITLMALLSPLCSALPTLKDQPLQERIHVTLNAKAPNAAFDGAAINAANSTFYIGADTQTYCPDGIQGLVCPPGNVTAINTDALGAGSSMYSLVPGGQPLYVRPPGRLSFTPAHLESIPIYNNYSIGPFAFTLYPDAADKGAFTFTGFESEGWLACGKEGKYQIHVDLKQSDEGSECQKIEIEGNVYEGEVPAWQYE